MTHHSLQPRSDSPRGFTIIELLVVISIMAIVIGTTSAAIAGMVRSNARESASNQIAAALNGARGLALRDGTDTAVLIEGTTDEPQLTVRILLRSDLANDVTAGRVRFVPRNDEAGEVLPSFIQVLGKNKAAEVVGASTPLWLGPSNTPATSSSTFVKPLIVWFDADGTLKNRPAGSGAIYYDRPGGTLGVVDAGEDVVPVPLLAIFDMRDYEEDELNSGNPLYADSTDAERNNFIRNASNNDRSILIFNRYTGNLMKR
jgi:prepilin-type N-terminal cleavage/methylation domain-containing protein